MKSFGLLLLRLVVGGLLAGHGAQKLFGTFGGGGVEGTAAWLRSLRLRPARPWAIAAGASELGAGVLTATGSLTPLGSVAGIAAMTMATTKVHLGKPVWVTTGGAELPLTNIAALSALALTGPGKLSVDRLLGIRVPLWITAAAVAGAAAAVVVGSQEELAAGTSEVGASDSDTARPTSGAASTTSAVVDVPTPGADDLGAAELPDEMGVAAMRVGESGADAGTAMGTGSELGSETGDDRV